MAANAPPSPPPASAAGLEVFLPLFLDTDLGTHLAMLVAADSTIRHLKSQVAMEHVAAFPDLGPITVNSFQVRRKSAMYHLSDSMLVRGAFTGVKRGCFLHVKMSAGAVHSHRDVPAMEDGSRLGERHLGVHVGKRARELPAVISEIASDVLPQGREGEEDTALFNKLHTPEALPSDVLPSSSSQHNTTRKEHEAVSLASDAQAVSNPVIVKDKSQNQAKEHINPIEEVTVISTSVVANGDKSTKQSNISQVEEEVYARKEEVLLGNGSREGVVAGYREVRKKDFLEEICAFNDHSKEKEHVKANKSCSFDTSAAYPIGETNESETSDVTKLDRVALETNTSFRGEFSNTSFQQEVHSNVQQGDSIQMENPSIDIDGKKKKRKMRQSESSKEAVPAREMTKPSPIVVEDFEGHMQNTNDAKEGHGSGGGHLGPNVSSQVTGLQPEMISEVLGKALSHRDSQGLQGGDADNVALTSRDKTKMTPSGLLSSSSQLSNGTQGTKHVGLVDDAQATTDLVVDQGKIDHVHKEHGNTTIGNKVNSTSEVGATEEKSTEGNTVPWAGGEKRSRKKRPLHDDGGHEEGIVSTRNIEKTSKSENTLGNIHSVGDISQEKKHKKANKVGSLDMTVVDTAREKDLSGYRENVTILDRVSIQRELVNGSFQQEISSNVRQGDSKVKENPNGDERKKKKKSRQSSKKASPNQGVKISSPELFTNESLIQNINASSVEANQLVPYTLEEATVSDRKSLNEDLDAVTTNVISEVLADLRSTDTLRNDLGGDLSTEQTNLSSNQSVSEPPRKSGDRVGAKEALPPKYPAAMHSEAPIGSPSHKKSRGKQSKVLSTVLGSSHSLEGVPEENGGTEFRESDVFKGSDKTTDFKDSLNSDIVAQTDDKTKATKHKRKKSSGNHLLVDDSAAIGSSGKQINEVAIESLKGADATEAALLQGGSVIASPASTVGKLQQKSKRSSKSRSSKIEETVHSSLEQDSQFSKDSHDEYIVDISGTHDNEHAAVVATQSSEVQKDARAVKSPSPNVKKGRKKSSKTDLQKQNAALEQGFDTDLINSMKEQGMGNSKNSADVVEPNDPAAVHLDSKKINFFEHFGASKLDGPSVSAENTMNKQGDTVKPVREKKKSKRKSDMRCQHAVTVEPNDQLAVDLHMDKTSLTDHFGTGKVDMPYVSAGNMNREDENAKQVKEKKKRKRKSDLVKPAAEQENPHYEHEDPDIGNHDLLDSVVHNGRMRPDNEKENNGKAILNNSVLCQEPEDATCDNTIEKNLHGSKPDDDNQNNLSIDKQGTQTKTKPHFNSTNHDKSIDARTGPSHGDVSNLVNSFSMSPPASSDSTEGTPQNVNRYRVAVRKIPIKKYEQTNEKSKKEVSKRSTGAIFNDAISEGSDDVLDTISKKAAMETLSDDSSTSAGSGISSAADDGKEVPDDDDGIASLSQRSLKKGLHIGSILRGSCSYKKARLKQTEHSEDTEVPDSQPVDIVFESQPNA